MASQASDDKQPCLSKCRLAEIVQYRCETETGERGQPQVHCWPVPRIFRICPGRPAVELTRFAEVDLNTGEISLPPETSQQLPKVKPWRDIVRYAEKVADFTGEKT